MAGVAGVGMSALAELLLALGHEVSGSDRSFDQGHQLGVLDKLQRMGLRLAKQDGSAISTTTIAMLVSTAIEESNPEVIAAKNLGIEIVHRADMLERLAKGKRVVAIAGTAGKTTTTALVGWLLEQCDLDPTVVNGGVIMNWATADRVGNCRVGKSDLFVLEVDESDKSLLRFYPAISAVTNVSKDHHEMDVVVSLFRDFALQTSGAVLCGNGVAAMLGLEAAKAIESPESVFSTHCVVHRDVDFSVPLIGRHNAENALMAIRVCEALGCSLGRIREMLPGFRGVGRRLEIVGETKAGARVIDDYAHNPAKIAASWRAVAESAVRVFGVWRPHGYGPLALMKDELADSLAVAMKKGDQLFVLPVFYAGGTTKKTITSEEWVAQLQARGMAAKFVADYVNLEKELSVAQRGDAILGMGARDPDLPKFARRLVANLGR